MENASGHVALVVGIADSLLEAYGGLPRTDIKRYFIDAFVAGDPNLVTALEAGPGFAEHW